MRASLSVTVCVHVIVGAVLGLVTFGLLLAINVADVRDSMAMAAHPHESLLVLAAIFSSMTAVGAGLSGFLLTVEGEH